MDGEARGVERILTAGPAHAQVSVRILLPILCAVLAVELTALGFLGEVAERRLRQEGRGRLPPETSAALKSAHLHRSWPGIGVAALSLLLVTFLCRKGVFDATGRWLSLAVILGMAVYPVLFVAALLLPTRMFMPSAW